MSFIFYILVGVAAGLCAGMLGIGGGLIIVPALIFIFQHQGIGGDVATHLAVGTSLAAIIPSAFIAALRYASYGLMRWNIVCVLGPGLFLGAILGGITTIHLRGNILQSILGIYLLLVIVSMLCNRKQTNDYINKPKKIGYVFRGIIIGWLSALFGIGGGSFTTPMLERHGVDIRNAITISTVSGFIVAIAGATTNGLLGRYYNVAAENSVGTLYWPALLAIIPSVLLFSYLGFSIGRRVDVKKLRFFFIVFLFIVSTKLVLGRGN